MKQMKQAMISDQGNMDRYERLVEMIFSDNKRMGKHRKG